MPRSELVSTLWIGNPTETGIAGFASAVILRPRTLVTSAHVWALEAPWWEAELPPRRELALFVRGVAGRVRVQGREVEVETPSRLVHAEFRLFAGDALQRPDDRRGEPVPAGWEQLEAFLAAEPYTVVGEAQQIEGLPGVSYPAGWPPPKGHSGGGVYRWNEEARQAQLVGVFNTWLPLRSEVTRQVAPLGLSALAFERRSEEDGWALVYAPLAPVVSALQPTPR